MSETMTRRMLRARARRRRGRWGWWVLAGVLALLVAVVLWIVIRGLIARDQLLGAMPLVQELKAKAVAGELAEIEPIAAELEERAALAAELTSDPVWRLLEPVPLVGPNLAAFRQAAAAVDTVASEALPPLVGIADELDLAAFLPKDGRVDVAGIAALQPSFAQASEAVGAAATVVDGIDTSGTVPQIGEAVEQLIRAVDEAGGLVDGLNGVIQILPAMLGADGPRDLLLIVQNNAQWRATGGIPGALALLHAEDGRVQIVEQTTAASLWPYGDSRPPVIPVTEGERALHGEWIAQAGTNTTLTPDFARTGEILAAMWLERTGVAIDGAVSVDPIALSYVLAATGPITLADGTVIDSENAAAELLNEPYFRYEDPADQDAFFASAAATVFDAILSYGGSPAAFIDAVVRGVDDHRIFVWSAHPEEEAAILANGYLGSLEPRSDRDADEIGVYLADNTSSKMDWYIEPSVTVGSVYCPAYGRPYYEVTVRLLNPVAAGGEGLPGYVTGRGVNGIPPGDVQTHVFVTWPAGSVAQQLFRGGASWVYQHYADEEYVRVGYTAVTPAGMTDEMTFVAFGPKGADASVRIVHTPTAGAFPVDLAGEIECPAPPTPGPAEEPGIAAPLLPGGVIVTRD